MSDSAWCPHCGLGWAHTYAPHIDQPLLNTALCPLHIYLNQTYESISVGTQCQQVHK